MTRIGIGRAPRMAVPLTAPGAVDPKAVVFLAESSVLINLAGILHAQAVGNFRAMGGDQKSRYRQEMSDSVALIVAAGRGERASSPGKPQVPKQYWPVAGKPVLRHTVQAFLTHFRKDAIFVVIRDEDRGLFDEAAGDLVSGQPITGGLARQDSVRLGLEAVAAQCRP